MIEVDWENLIYLEIQNPRLYRKDVAFTYACILSSKGDKADYAKINKAILSRWSMSGLVYIKEQSWKLEKQAS